MPLGITSSFCCPLISVSCIKVFVLHTWSDSYCFSLTDTTAPTIFGSLVFLRDHDARFINVITQPRRPAATIIHESSLDYLIHKTRALSRAQPAKFSDCQQNRKMTLPHSYRVLPIPTFFWMARPPAPPTWPPGPSLQRTPSPSLPPHPGRPPASARP